MGKKDTRVHVLQLKWTTVRVLHYKHIRILGIFFKYEKCEHSETWLFEFEFSLTKLWFLFLSVSSTMWKSKDKRPKYLGMQRLSLDSRIRFFVVVLNDKDRAIHNPSKLRIESLKLKKSLRHSSHPPFQSVCVCESKITIVELTTADFV